ncbi:MAG: hypothetical protein Q4B96_04520 [Bacillota bacterium]|nr:hypothetical protein [Bacillota bacterium]
MPASYDDKQTKRHIYQQEIAFSEPPPGPSAGIIEPGAAPDAEPDQEKRRRKEKAAVENANAAAAKKAVRRPQAQRPRRSIFSRYRIVPLITVGLLLSLLLIFTSTLIWSWSTYNARADIADAAPLTPTLIYLLSLFAAALLMTLLIRGGTVFPSLAVALIITGLSLWLAGAEELTVLGVTFKTLLSLLAAILGFTIGKLICLAGRR